MKTTASGLGMMAMGLLALAAGAPAWAGEPARTMSEIEDRLKPGTEIDVVDREGRVLRGDFARADSQGVLISVLGSTEGRRVAAADVATVTRKGDSLKNGILIGAGIGLAMGALVAGADPNPDDDFVWCDGGSCAEWMAFSTLTYAGIGALIDFLVKGREVVYRAPTDRLSWSVTPHPVPRGAGVRVALKF